MKKFPWLRIFYSLLVIALVNLILAYHFLTPPGENEPILFWPIILYSKLIVPLVLFIPLGFLCTIGVYLLRRKWMAAFASILVLIVATYVSFVGFLFSESFDLVDNVKIEDETFHLGAVSNLDGGLFFAFCSEKEGLGTCDYFFTQYWLPGLPELKLDTETQEVLVTLQNTTIYQYNGRFPGRCIASAEEFVSGSCEIYYHGGN
jgi:hypothetical protein